VRLEPSRRLAVASAPRDPIAGSPPLRWVCKNTAFQKAPKGATTAKAV